MFDGILLSIWLEGWYLWKQRMLNQFIFIVNIWNIYLFEVLHRIQLVWKIDIEFLWNWNQFEAWNDWKFRTAAADQLGIQYNPCYEILVSNFNPSMLKLRLIWSIWTSLSAFPRTAVIFNHSLCWNQIILGGPGQYCCCLCPGTLCCQVIGIHIALTLQVLFLAQGMISMPCTILM